MAQLVADFLVNDSKRSEHAFGSVEEETAALIENYFVRFTGSHQEYLFPPWEARRRGDNKEDAGMGEGSGKRLRGGSAAAVAVEG